MGIEQGLDPEAFVEFRDLLGKARARLWVSAFLRQLDDVFSPPASEIPDRDVLFHAAHKIIGSAGIVGCTDLAEACRQLQAGSRSEAAIAELYLATQTAARQAAASLSRQMINPD
jgi:HPt (histidine-containing phosphotransfer) domain-containing protein